MAEHAVRPAEPAGAEGHGVRVTQLLRSLRLVRAARLIQLLRVVKVGVRMHILLRLVRKFAANAYVVGLTTIFLLVAGWGQGWGQASNLYFRRG
ncbi:MAG: hypothetical protein WC538_21245 [Thermoanaerobaculia bacterium]